MLQISQKIQREYREADIAKNDTVLYEKADPLAIVKHAMSEVTEFINPAQVPVLACDHSGKIS